LDVPRLPVGGLDFFFAPLLRAAHLAFIASDNFFLPAAVSPRLVFVVASAGPPVLRLAHRAFAAALSLARAVADIGRRRVFLRDFPNAFEVGDPTPPKSVNNRSSSVLICCLNESACVSF
jgi:hypothetical protein